MSAESGKAQPVAYLISDPSEPDLGHWFGESPAPADCDWLVSQPLFPHPDPVRAALVEALKEASESLGHMGAEHLKSRVDAALRAAGEVL